VSDVKEKVPKRFKTGEEGTTLLLKKENGA